MKRLTMMALALALTLAGLLAVPLWAEESGRLEAEIPFAFYAGEVWMMPGEYQIGHLNQSVILVRSPELKASSALIVYRSKYRKGEDRAYLVFNKYEGERYFLSQVWQPGEDHGAELMKTRREREVVTSVLRSEARKPEQVVILARLVR